MSFNPIRVDAERMGEAPCVRDLRFPGRVGRFRGRGRQATSNGGLLLFHTTRPMIEPHTGSRGKLVASRIVHAVWVPLPGDADVERSRDLVPSSAPTCSSS